jgi:hypothetical protein
MEHLGVMKTQHHHEAEQQETEHPQHDETGV